MLLAVSKLPHNLGAGRMPTRHKGPKVQRQSSGYDWILCLKTHLWTLKFLLYSPLYQQK